MTIPEKISSPRDKTITINRTLYGLFIIIAVYFLATQRMGEAMSNLGIALLFDPFDQKVMWNNRPAYQRVWLIVHVSIVAILLALLALQNFYIR